MSAFSGAGAVARWLGMKVPRTKARRAEAPAMARAVLNPLSDGRTAPGLFDRANPANARTIEIVDALSDVAKQAGIALPHLAAAFVRTHPAITSVIIGPRTPQQLDDLLAAADLTLTDDILDAIDAIVAPGVEVLAAGYHATPPSITDPKQRRR
ncbi:aldo/keto reductase [Streptomyces sp. NY05-11A]|uniref:aldo/keto reductase n=1 Tax=Streptomyces soliscabiei TaxID=588897 RepID=UPI0029A03C38|nr:aldo/keto reductase [Streptomyces sp. NY05-11A]MDX2683080.1 aldo/keto reductase [Streptomyces sp. NY05-11A]